MATAGSRKWAPYMAQSTRHGHDSGECQALDTVASTPTKNMNHWRAPSLNSAEIWKSLWNHSKNFRPESGPIFKKIYSQKSPFKRLNASTTTDTCWSWCCKHLFKKPWWKKSCKWNDITGSITQVQMCLVGDLGQGWPTPRCFCGPVVIAVANQWTRRKPGSWTHDGSVGMPY